MTDARATTAALRDGCGVLDLGGRDVVRLAGADTPAFLNRLLTLDTRKLEVGQRRAAFLLEAKGRVKLAFDLARIEPAVYLAYARAGHGADIAALLDFYHFGEAFECAPQPTAAFALIGPKSAAVLAALNLPVPELGQRVPVTDGAVTRVDAYGVESYEVEGADVAQATRAGAIEVSPAAVEALRIQNGIGAAPAELNEDAVPLEVNGLSGITEGKGCYPGQEVIERILAIGRPARRLVTLRLSGPAEPGPLTLDGAPAGQLTSVAQVDDGWWGLGLVKRKLAVVEGELRRDDVVAVVTRVREEEGAR